MAEKRGAERFPSIMGAALMAALVVVASGVSDLVAGPGQGPNQKVCYAAHPDSTNSGDDGGCHKNVQNTPYTCDEDNPTTHSCSGSRWDTAVAGACVDPTPANPAANCVANAGPTLITIQKWDRTCDFLFSCGCQVSDSGQTDDKPSTDCSGTPKS